MLLSLQVGGNAGGRDRSCRERVLTFRVLWKVFVELRLLGCECWWCQIKHAVGMLMLMLMGYWYVVVVSVMRGAGNQWMVRHIVVVVTTVHGIGSSALVVVVMMMIHCG